MAHARTPLLTCALFAVMAGGCAKEVAGRPFGPAAATGETSASAGDDTDDAGDPKTTSISASASDGSSGDDSSGDDETSGEPPDPTDSGSTGDPDPTDGLTSGVDSSQTDGGDDGGGDSTGVMGGDLDPLLDIAESGEVCATPGHLGECSGIATVCRFHDSASGRCESCEGCGNLDAPCTDGTDCDILFACFAGHCTNFCTLGTYECGAPSDCLDVGHPTRGVCDPSAL